MDFADDLCADLVFINGKIVTLDKENKIAQAARARLSQLSI